MTTSESQPGFLSTEAFGHAAHEEETHKQRKNVLSRQDQARFLVMVYINGKRKKAGRGRIKFSDDQVFLVWFSKTLKNWKALVGTTLDDNFYYEVTHNGEKNETYVDVYDKIDNVVFPHPE